MRLVRVFAMVAGFGFTASAGIITTYTDQITNNNFAAASYTLIAGNNRAITSSSFSGGQQASGGVAYSPGETAGKPDMFEPNSGVMLLLPGDSLISAEYDLSYQFDVDFKRTVTDTGGGGGDADPDISWALTNPVFGSVNDDFSITLVFKDINGVALRMVNVTSLTSLNLMPYLTGGGAVQNAFDTTGVYVGTAFRADDVVFSADLTGYDPSNDPDRNVIIDYNVVERLNANSSVTLDIDPAPEPATFGVFSLGLAALIGLGRKFRT
ncbi:MAG: hypothetical protein ABSF62_14945 [Bryobacteraceae bacterium]